MNSDYRPNPRHRLLNLRQVSEKLAYSVVAEIRQRNRTIVTVLGIVSGMVE